MHAVGMPRSAFSRGIIAAPPIAPAGIHRPTFRRPIDAYNQDRAAEDLADVVRAVADGPAHIVGLSMGGFAALHFGLRYPQLARSLTIAGVGYGAKPEQQARISQFNAARSRACRGHRHGGFCPRACRQQLRAMPARQGRSRLASLRRATWRACGDWHGDDAARRAGGAAIALASRGRVARAYGARASRHRRRRRSRASSRISFSRRRCRTRRSVSCRAPAI